MPQLEHLLDEWARSVIRAEPHLEPHLDEIRDHLRTDAQARIDEGAEVASAFAAAIGAFGAPREVAFEFLKSSIPSHSRILKYVAAYLLAVLVLTAVIVVVDDFYPLNVTWVAIGLTSIVTLPAIAIPFHLERLFLARCAGMASAPPGRSG